MPLLAVLTSKDQIPSGMESHYVEREGRFYLDLDGESVKLHPSTSALKKAYDATRQELDEVKGNLRSTKEELGDIDLAKARELLAKEDEIRHQKLVKEGQIETIKADVAKKFDLQIAELTKERDAALTKNRELIVKYELSAACVEAGIIGCEELLLDRAKETFAVEKDGSLVALDSEGRKLMVDGETPLTLGAWVDRMVERFSLKPPSTGGGGRPPAPKVQNVANPYKKDSFNLTAQFNLEQSNPELASRLQREAAGAA